MRNKKRWLAMMLAAAMTITSVGVSPLGGINTAYAEEVAPTIVTKIPDQLQNGVNPPDLMKEPALATITLSDGTILTRGVDFTVSTAAVKAGPAKATFTGIKYSKWPTVLGTSVEVDFKIVDNVVAPTDTYEVIESSNVCYDGDELDSDEINDLYLVVKNGISALTINKDRATAKDAGDLYAVVEPIDKTKADGNAGEKHTIKILVNSGDSDQSKDKEIYNKVVTIQKKNINDLAKANIEVDDASDYDGTAKTTSITKAEGVSKGESAESIMEEVEITGYSNNINATTDTSKAKATISAKSTSKNYTGSTEREFAIGKFNLSGANTNVVAELAKDSLEYTGSELDAGLSVDVYTSKTFPEAKKLPKSDYKVELKENVAAGDDTATYTILPSDSGNLYGSVEAGTFSITQADFAKVTVSQIKDIEVGTDKDTLNSTIGDYFSVTYLGKTVDPTEYVVDTVADSEVGEGEVTLKSKDKNFSTINTQKLKIKVAAKDMASKYTATNALTYTGSAITPIASQLTIAGMTPTVDYEIIPNTYSNNINVGTATVKIKGVGKYLGKTSIVEYKIEPKDIYSSSAYSYTVSGITSGVYAKGSKIPNATVTVKTKTTPETVVTTLSSKDCDVIVNKISENKITEVKVVAKGNYTNSSDIIIDGLNVAVDPVNLANATVTAKVPAGLKSYEAANIKKYITVSVAGNELGSEAFDIEKVTKPTEDAVGKEIEFTVKAADDTNTSGTKTVKAKLVAADISIFDIKKIDEDPGTDVKSGTYTYSGKAIEPEVEFVDVANVEKLTKNTDYKLSYANNVDAGKATVTVTGIGKYAGSFSREFEIEKKKISELTEDNVNLPSYADRAYRGEAFDLSSKISLKAGKDEHYVFSSADYSVEKKTTVAEDNKNSEKYKVGASVVYKITATENSKNYAGSKEVSYDITKRNVQSNDIKVELAKSEIDVVELGKAIGDDAKKNAIKAFVKKVAVDGKELSASDYDLTVAGDLTAISSKTNETYIHVTLKNNYAGDTKVNFTITEAEVDLSKVVIKAPTDLVYDNEDATGSKQATAHDPFSSATGKYAIEYKNAEGEVISSTDVKDAGTYTATVVGAANYKGINGKSVTFTITPYEISDAEWEATTIKLKNAKYAGEKTEAPVIDTDGFSAPASIPGTISIAEFEVVSFDKDWDGKSSTYEAKIATKAGTNYIYKGDAKVVTFKYDKATIDPTNINDFFEIKDQVYTGNAIEPVITAKEGSKADASWVTVKSYNSNVNISSKSAYAEVSVTVPANASDYFGNVTDVPGKIYFTIKAASIETATVEGIKDAEYTGKAIKQNVEVTTADGLVLTLGKDYKVSYANNVNPGTATVTISGFGNYTGKIVKTFKITKKETPVVKTDISKATVTGLKTVTYNGKAFKPVVKVVVNGKTLVLNKDYKVAYSNNIKPGTAKVVITGIGSYKGTVTKSFVIKKAAQSITKAVVSKTFKASSLKKKAATFSINAKAKGKITYKKTSGSKNITVSKSGKVTVKKGTKKGTYTIKVKITAAATSYYLSKSVTKTIKVVVK